MVRPSFVRSGLVLGAIVSVVVRETMALAVSISIGSADVPAGTTVAINVTMYTGGASVAGVQNDIIFDPTLVSLAKRLCDQRGHRRQA